MLKTLIAFAVIIAAPLLAAQAPPLRRVLLTWTNPNRTNPVDDPNILYRVWHTNQLANITNQATTNWTLLTTLPNVPSATNLGVFLMVPQDVNFFAVSASNFYEVFSTNARTPASPSGVSQLLITLTN